MMKNIKRSIWLILIFLALGWLTHCGGSILDKKEVVDTVNPIVTITSPADGAFVASTTVVVTGTVSDPVPSSGLPETITVVIPGSAEVTQSAQVTQNVTIGAGGNWTTTFTGVPEGPNQTVIALLNDLSGNPGSDTNTFEVLLGPSLAIVEPTGGEILTANGVTWGGSVIVTIPVDIEFKGGVTPYGLTNVNVWVDGKTQTKVSYLYQTYPDGGVYVDQTGIEGRLVVLNVNDTSGSRGLLTNVSITVDGLVDDDGTSASAVNRVVNVRLAEISAEDIIVPTNGTTFTMPINIYFDESIFANGLSAANVELHWDNSVLTYNGPVTPSGVFVNTNFAGPVDDNGTPLGPVPANGWSRVRLYNNANGDGAAGFFNFGGASFSYSVTSPTIATATNILFFQYDHLDREPKAWTPTYGKDTAKGIISPAP